MARSYKLGARTSPLSLKQTEEVLGLLRRHYPDFRVEVVGIDTCGDVDKSTSISQMEGTDFFTDEIDKALLQGEIDFAVHSAKDLPDVFLKGLYLAAITRSIDPDDVLVSKEGLRLDQLGFGARIGTSSLRRKIQLRTYREDFRIVDIRGNIEQRLKILDETPGLDGIVIAAAGLLRLGLEDRITQRVPHEILKPHPLQGALAIVVRRKDFELSDLFSVVDSRKEASYGDRALL